MKLITKTILGTLILGVSLNASNIKYKEVKNYGVDNNVNNGISTIVSPVNKPLVDGKFKFLSCSGIHDYPLIPQQYKVFYVDVEGDGKIEYKGAINKDYFSKCDNMIIQYIVPSKVKGEKSTIYSKKVKESELNEFVEVKKDNVITFIKDKDVKTNKITEK